MNPHGIPCATYSTHSVNVRSVRSCARLTLRTISVHPHLVADAASEGEAKPGVRAVALLLAGLRERRRAARAVERELGGPEPAVVACGGERQRRGAGRIDAGLLAVDHRVV